MGNVNTQITAIAAANLLGALLIFIIPGLIDIKDFSCACVLIRQNDAQSLINYVQSSSSPNVIMKFRETSFGATPAPVVASTASRGPSKSHAGILKPDIMAPGSLVLGAWLPKKEVARIKSGSPLYSDYNIEFGTSAACPHVSGVVALLKGAHSDWSTAAIRSAIMTTATH
jgi:subtilisin family serine protease